MPSLIYFPLRARAESIRFIARYCKLDVKDEIVELKDWPQVKPTMPNGAVPVLRKDDGNLLPESADIAFHLAEHPDVPADRKLLVDEEHKEMYLLTQGYPTRVLDIFNPLLNWFSRAEADPKIDESLPLAVDQMKKYDARLNESGGPFITGKQPGVGDLGVYHFVCNMQTLRSDCFQDFSPLWSEWQKSVAGLPGIKEYLAERPEIGTGKTGREGSYAYHGFD